MVACTNPRSTGIPNFGRKEEAKFTQCKTAQCDTAQLWKLHAVRQPCLVPWGQALLQLDGSALTCSGLLPSALARHAWGFSSSRGNTVFSEKGKWASRAPGEMIYRDKSLLLWSLIGPSHVNIDFKLSQFDGPKGIVLIGQNGASLFGWWRSWWGYICAAPIRWGKPHSYWFEYDFRNSWTPVSGMAGTQWRQVVQCRRQVIHCRLLPEV